MELTELKNRICESFSGDRVELQKILDLVVMNRRTGKCQILKNILI
jgi:hypothetical protein